MAAAKNATDDYSAEGGVYVIDIMPFWKWENADGDLHRDGGPAVIFDNGSREMWLDGKKHCLEGYAVYDSYTATTEWWVDGVQYFSRETFEKAVDAYLPPGRLTKRAPSGT